MTHPDHHTNDQESRRCPAHDEGNHWVDDLAYVEEADRLPVPEYAPTYKDMVEIIRQNMPANNPAIYRFALVFVEGETGGIQCLSSAGLEPSSCINLLSRAVSILAFQDMRMEKAAMNTVRGLAAKVGARIAERMHTFPEADDKDDPPIGQYL